MSAEQSMMKQKFFSFSNYISKDISNFPARVYEGIKIYFGYNAVYGVREFDGSGNVKICELYGDKRYMRDHALYKRKLAKSEIFEQNMARIIQESVPQKKWVWRIQDLGYTPEDFFETEYGKLANRSGFGYRAVIVARQPLGKYYHSLSVYKHSCEGDFTQEEVEVLEWIAMLFGIALNAYFKDIESKAVLQLFTGRFCGEQRQVCVLDSHLCAVYKTSMFDSVSAKVLGTREMMEFLLPMQDQLEKASRGTVYEKQFESNGEVTTLTVSVFVPETNLSSHDNKLIQIELSSQNVPVAEVREESALSEDRISQYGFSARECDVLKLMMENVCVDGIAERLYISKATVRTHISHIYKKMGVNSRLEVMEKLGKMR